MISNMSKANLFADDKSIIIINSSPSDFKKNINYVVIKINNWFNSNLLSLILIKPIFYHS